jgi:hypothetical protein
MLSPHAPPHPRPRLRVVDDAGVHHATRGRAREHLPAVESAHRAAPASHVLVAGADANARAMMLEELRNLLPASTRFLEARETWEVLAGASDSRMVVLADDLRDVSSAALVRLLGRRHPALPVLAVGEWTHASASVDTSAIGV